MLARLRTSEQGRKPRTDQVSFTVASKDSAKACKATAGRNCRRAVAYNGFNGINGGPDYTIFAQVYSTRRAKIIFKMPGVTFVYGEHRGPNGTALIYGTMNNYGDPRKCAAYSVELTTKPLAPVELVPTGLDRYSAVAPAAIVLDASNWMTPQLVRVCAGAASPNRPVCPGQNQIRCPLNGLYDRNESFTHYVHTADPVYGVVGRQINGTYKFARGGARQVGVGFMKLVALVQYDRDPPPAMGSASMADQLNAVVLTFNRDTDFGGKAGTFPCTGLLDFGGKNETTLLGQGAKCYWVRYSPLIGTPAVAITDELLPVCSFLTENTFLADCYVNFSVPLLDVTAGA